MINPKEAAEHITEVRRRAIEEMDEQVRKRISEYAGEELTIEQGDERYDFLCFDAPDEGEENVMFNEIYVVIDFENESLIAAYHLRVRIESITPAEEGGEGYTMKCNVTCKRIDEYAKTFNVSAFKSGEPDLSDILVKKEQE